MKKLSLDKKFLLENNVVNINSDFDNINNNIQTNNGFSPNFQTLNNEATNNSSDSNKISLAEYMEAAKIDHLTILKIIVFILFVTVGIFVLYHVFFGENGFLSQKEKISTLNELEKIELQKEKELNLKMNELEALNKKDEKTMELEARKKGYIYSEEMIIKIVEENNDNENDKPPLEKESSKNSLADSLNTDYLLIAIIVSIALILLSYIVNVRKSLRKKHKVQ